MFSKKLIILITIISSLAIILAVVIDMATARRGSAEYDRARYMSDILRITEGVMPVLWIAPQYSRISNAKYFDLSGNANHGEQASTTCQPTFNPPGLDFNGTTTYVDCGNDASLNITEAITIEAWMKPAVTFDSSAVEDCEIVRKGNNDYYIFRLDDITGKARLILDFSGGSVASTQTSWTAETWYHLVGTYNGSTLRIFVDGVESNSVDASGSYTTDANLYIGSQIGTDRFFNGTIDEVKIYDIALTASQIQALYLAGLPKHRR